MDVAAAELLGGHLLAGRGADERRAAEVDRPLLAHDDVLVAHRRHVGAAGGRRAVHHRHLRDAGRRHHRLVVEDAAPGREDVGLERQEGAARVDEVDARQAVLVGDLLRAELLLHGERVEVPPFTVTSLAMTRVWWPETVPMPVTMPAAGVQSP